MTHLQLDPSFLNTLDDTVVVLTGGATGIGRATIQPLCSESTPRYRFNHTSPLSL